MRQIRRVATRALACAAIAGGVAIGAAGTAFAYGPTGNTAGTSSATVSPGGTVLFEGHLNCDNCSVQVYLDGRYLTTTVTNGVGDFAVSVTIPSSYSGVNTLTAVAANGATASTTIDVLVVATSPTAALASTGADVAGAIGVAAAAIGVGGGLVLLSRRRRPGDLA